MAYVQLFANSRLLATSGTLADVLGQTVQAVAQRLQNWNPDELLNTPVDDVVEYLVDEGSVRCPQLRVGDAYQLDSEEVDQEFEDFGRRLTRRVVRLVLVVPCGIQILRRGRHRRVSLGGAVLPGNPAGKPFTDPPEHSLELVHGSPPAFRA